MTLCGVAPPHTQAPFRRSGACSTSRCRIECNPAYAGLGTLLRFQCRRTSRRGPCTTCLRLPTPPFPTPLRLLQSTQRPPTRHSAHTRTHTQSCPQTGGDGVRRQPGCAGLPAAWRAAAGAAVWRFVWIHPLPHLHHGPHDRHGHDRQPAHRVNRCYASRTPRRMAGICTCRQCTLEMGRWPRVPVAPRVLILESLFPPRLCYRDLALAGSSARPTPAATPLLPRRSAALWWQTSVVSLWASSISSLRSRQPLKLIQALRHKRGAQGWLSLRALVARGPSCRQGCWEARCSGWRRRRVQASPVRLAAVCQSAK